eukprot:11201304-Lingulodinium_polyedra.AAC.1
MAALDLSDIGPEGSLAYAAGGVPDYFNRLLLPRVFWPFFCLDVPLDRLRAAVASAGRPGPAASARGFLCAR